MISIGLFCNQKYAYITQPCHMVATNTLQTGNAPVFEGAGWKVALTILEQ